MSRPDAAKLFSHLALVNGIIGNFEMMSDDPYEKQENAPWTNGKLCNIEVESELILDAAGEMDPEKNEAIISKVRLPAGLH